VSGTDGKVQWERVLAKGVGDPKNLASASPTADGVHVWAYSGTGDLVCFKMDGTEVWRAQLQEKYGKFKLGFGMTTTPLVHAGVIYLQLIHSGGAWVVALDASSGKELWKTERKSDGVDECEHSYASIQFWPAACWCRTATTTRSATIRRTERNCGGSGDLNPKEKYNKTLRFVSSPLATADLIVVPTAKGGAVVGLDPRAKGKVDRQNAVHQKWR
jgi:hypothetical protein